MRPGRSGDRDAGHLPRKMTASPCGAYRRGCFHPTGTVVGERLEKSFLSFRL